MSVFGRGIPTAIDVEKLRQTFGVPEVGANIEYHQLESVTDLKRGSYRFITVIGAWRRKLYRESNILLRAIPNVGFEVLDAHGRVDVAGSIFKRGLRRIAKSTDIAMRTSRESLTVEESRVVDHLVRTGAQMRLIAATSAKSPTLAIQILTEQAG